VGLPPYFVAVVDTSFVDTSFVDITFVDIGPYRLVAVRVLIGLVLVQLLVLLLLLLQMPSPAKPIYEWTARIEFNKYELGSSFGVHIFLGDVPDNSREWQTSPNLVGSHYAYVSSGQSYGYGGSGGIEEGFVHLNRGIVDHSGLPSLEPEVVEPYLTGALQWRAQLAGGQPAHLNSLEVAVYVTPLTFPPGSQFPVPGEARRLDGITYGRDGGSRHAPA